MGQGLTLPSTSVVVKYNIAISMPYLLIIIIALSIFVHCNCKRVVEMVLILSYNEVEEGIKLTF